MLDKRLTEITALGIIHTHNVTKKSNRDLRQRKERMSGGIG